MPTTADDNHCPEFRDRVLRRVAERDDLDAVAREFGLSPDVVFSWLADSVDHGHRLGTAATPSPVTSTVASLPAVRHRRSPADDIAVVRGLVATMAMLLGSAASFVGFIAALGSVDTSHAFFDAMLPVVAGVALMAFLWIMRALTQFDVRTDIPARDRIVLAAVIGSVSALSAWMWTFTLPSIAHRFARKPAEIRTVVADKSIHRGKNSTCYQVTTAVFDARYPPHESCVERSLYGATLIGDTLVLHGTASWFGFEMDSFELVPRVPAAAAR